MATFELYNFESKQQRKEVELFLKDFKKKHLLNSFYFYSIGYSIINLKLRYLFLIFIFKIPLLLHLLIKFKAKRIKFTP